MVEGQDRYNNVMQDDEQEDRELEAELQARRAERQRRAEIRRQEALKRRKTRIWLIAAALLILIAVLAAESLTSFGVGSSEKKALAAAEEEIKAGDYQTAAVTLQKAKSDGSGAASRRHNTAVLRYEGILSYLSGDYASAVTSFQDALALESGSAAMTKDLLYYLESAEEASGDYTAAIQTCSRIQGLTKDDELSVRKVYLQMKTGELSAADGVRQLQQAQTDGSTTAAALISEYRTSMFEAVAESEQKGDWAQAKADADSYLALFADDEKMQRELTFLNTRTD